MLNDIHSTVKRNLTVKVVESRNNETAEGKKKIRHLYLSFIKNYDSLRDYQTGKVSASRSFSDN